MAVQNRAVVGYIQCDGCGDRATVHQAQRASKKGLLYTRCDQCGCDQRTGKAVQQRWSQKIQPMPGYEHLKLPADEPEQQPEKPEKAGPVAKAEKTEPATETKPNALPIGDKSTMKNPAFAGLLAVGITLLTLGAIK
jgi:hypothetical protein